MRVWRGPCLDWLQHKWPDDFSPPWGGEVMMVKGHRVARITGYAAAAVPWTIVHGLGDGACRVTRLDLCCDLEGDLALPTCDAAVGSAERETWLRERGEREYAGSKGYTRYRGSAESELQWRAYRYNVAALADARPWLWHEEARLAGVDLAKVWRVEVQARGRLARALAAAPSITDAWAMLAPRWPDWPRVGPAETPWSIPPVRPAELRSAAELAARARKYIASQARRCAKKVGLAPDAARGLLQRVAMEALAELAGCGPDGVVESWDDDDDTIEGQGREE